jgi:integrase
MFEHAVKRGLVERNPMRLVTKIKRPDKPPGILTPDQLKNILQAAPSDLVPAIAIQAFAGVRTAEILRMEWSEIDLVGGFVNVAAAKSNTANRRLVPISSNLSGTTLAVAAESGLISAQWSHTSTRRFCSRPSAVSFEAIGSAFPYPLTRDGTMPCLCNCSATACARCVEITEFDRVPP